MVQLTKKRLILSKVEGVYGIDSAPTGAFDAIHVFDLEIIPLQGEVIDRETVRPYYGASEQLLANTRVEVSMSVELTGSGVVGVTPQFSSLLRACSLSETVTSGPVAGTAAGGGVNAITLDGSASSVERVYVGRIIRVTGGLGQGTLGLIIDYAGASKVASIRPLNGNTTYDSTSVYSIDISTVYEPISDNPESATIYYNVDGTLHRITGCRGSCSVVADLGSIPAIEFVFNGIYNPPTDTALPAVTYANQGPPSIFKAGNTGAFALLGFRGCLQSVVMDLSNELIFRDLLNCPEEVFITARDVNGSVGIEAPALAGVGGKDFFAAALSGVVDLVDALLTEDSFDLLYEDSGQIYLDPTDPAAGDLSFIHGKTAGNLVALLSSRIDLVDPDYEEADGIQGLSVPYVATPSTNGNDEFMLIFA